MQVILTGVLVGGPIAAALDETKTMLFISSQNPRSLHSAWHLTRPSNRALALQRTRHAKLL
jgi:hypothetical protein